MPKNLRAGILAATGTVGQRFIELLANHNGARVCDTLLLSAGKLLGQSFSFTGARLDDVEGFRVKLPKFRPNRNGRRISKPALQDANGGHSWTARTTGQCFTSIPAVQNAANPRSAFQNAVFPGRCPMSGEAIELSPLFYETINNCGDE